MFFATPTPSPAPSPVVPATGSLALDTDLILLLIAVVVIAWAVGQLAVIIFKTIRSARRHAQTHHEKNSNEDEFN